MEGIVRVHSYPWKYRARPSAANEDQLYVTCWRHSGPVSKYHDFTVPLENLKYKGLHGIVEDKLTLYAQEHGA